MIWQMQNEEIKYQRPYKSEVSTDRDNWRAIGRCHVRLMKEGRDLQEKEKEEKKTWEEEQTNGDLQSNERLQELKKRERKITCQRYVQQIVIMYAR